MYLPIYQPSNGLHLFYTKLLQGKKRYTKYLVLLTNDKCKVVKNTLVVSKRSPSLFLQIYTYCID